VLSDSRRTSSLFLPRYFLIGRISHFDVAAGLSAFRASCSGTNFFFEPLPGIDFTQVFAPIAIDVRQGCG
jgi:hypothetical protein